MTDISKEAVGRLIKEGLTEIAISVGLKVTDHDVKVMTKTADMLRALSARVQELEAMCNNLSKGWEGCREQGKQAAQNSRLQALDDVADRVRHFRQSRPLTPGVRSSLIIGRYEGEQAACIQVESLIEALKGDTQ